MTWHYFSPILSSHTSTNGVIEQKYRHLLEVTWSLLFSVFDPKCYWAEVVLTTVLLINITPSFVSTNMSPYSRLHRHSINYSLLRTFECICFVLLPSHERDILSFKIRKCIFLGHSSAHKRYRYYDPTTIWLRIAWHVSFFENISYYHSSHI